MIFSGFSPLKTGSSSTEILHMERQSQISRQWGTTLRWYGQQATRWAAVWLAAPEGLGDSFTTMSAIIVLRE